MKKDFSLPLEDKELKAGKSSRIASNFNKAKGSLTIKKFLIFLMGLIGLLVSYRDILKNNIFFNIKTYLYEKTDFGKIEYLTNYKPLNESLLSDEDNYSLEGFSQISSNENLLLVNSDYKSYIEDFENLVEYEDSGYLMKEEVLENYVKLKEELRDKDQFIHLIPSFRDEKL